MGVENFQVVKRKALKKLQQAEQVPKVVLNRSSGYGPPISSSQRTNRFCKRFGRLADNMRFLISKFSKYPEDRNYIYLHPKQPFPIEFCGVLTGFRVFLSYFSSLYVQGSRWLRPICNSEVDREVLFCLCHSIHNILEPLMILDVFRSQHRKH